MYVLLLITTRYLNIVFILIYISQKPIPYKNKHIHLYDL